MTPVNVDWDIFSQCRDAVAKGAGVVDGNRVLIVDGNEIKIREDQSGDAKPHMDFVEGANDLEAAWVKREFGSGVLLVDGRMDRKDWAYNLYHEAVERRDMAKGMSYAAAHARANSAERRLRTIYKERQ